MAGPTAAESAAQLQQSLRTGCVHSSPGGRKALVPSVLIRGGPTTLQHYLTTIMPAFVAHADILCRFEIER